MWYYGDGTEENELSYREMLCPPAQNALKVAELVVAKTVDVSRRINPLLDRGLKLLEALAHSEIDPTDKLAEAEYLQKKS